MRYPDRATVCVSSQAGCGMACPFCATGQGGLQRNLSTGGDRRAGAPGRGRRPRRRARRAHAPVQRGVHGHGRAAGQLPPGGGRRPPDHRARPDGLGISARGVTVSTVGLVPAIDRLAAEGLPVTLAVSLHTPDDELRDTLVPVNTRWKVAEVLAAARRYADGHRAAGVDRVRADPGRQRPAVAGRPARHGAAAAIGAKRVHVNLIPLNPTPGSEWDASPRKRQDEFVRRVETRGRRLHRARHPRPGDRRRLRPARRHLRTGRGPRPGRT